MVKVLRSVLIFAGIPIVVLLGSLLIGPGESVTASDLLLWLRDGVPDHPLFSTILVDIRLPRILLAFLVGSALAVSGASMQAVFRNPLVDPFILGTSAGAAFGAALAMATGILPVQISAFLFASVAVGMSYVVSGSHRAASTVALVLAGVVVSGVFTALLTLVQFMSDPFRLQTIVHWTMGTFQTAGWEKLQEVFLPIAAGMTFLILWRWRLNVLSLSDEESVTSGINPRRERLSVLIAATIATSSAVAVAGIIGFYGLFVPHLVRMTVGSDHRRTLPLNIVVGGTLLVLLDDGARSLTSYEIPLGVFTMLLGAPFFILLMKRTKIGWQE